MEYTQVLLFIYLALLLSVVFVKRLKSNTELDFTLSNRNLGLFPFVATIVATAYGWILAVGELYYIDGITAWVYLSLPYMLGFIVFGLLLAKKARATNNVTISDLLKSTYNNKVATFGTLFFLVYLFPAMYILMSAQLLQSILGIGIEWCLLIATLFSMIYVLTGGFKAVVFTDVIQFIIMFGGFAAASIYLFNNFGDVTVSKELISTHLEFNISGSWVYILSWFLLATITLVDPAVYQRVYAVKSPRVAVTGIFLAIACWLVFDAMEATTGIFTRILLPDIPNVAVAYPELAAQILPANLSAVFVLGMLAVIMSTTDSFLFLSALTLAKDVLKPNRIFSEVSTQKLTQYNLVIVSAICFIITLIYRHSSVVELFFDFVPVTVSVLLLPILSAYYPKLTLKSGQVLAQMLISFVICISYQIVKPSLGAGFEEINPVYFGLGTALTLQLIFSLINRK